MLHPLQHLGQHARVLPRQIGAGAAGLSARTPCANPSDRPMAMPTASKKALPDLLRHRSLAYVRRSLAASRQAAVLN